MSGRETQHCCREMVASPWPAPGRMQKEIALPTDGGFGFAQASNSVRQEFAAAWAACGAFEWVALGYLALSSFLIALFAAHLQHPLRLLATQAFVALVVLALCRVAARAAARATLHGMTFSSRWWRFWRHWYPHLFFLFCFEELAHLMTLVTQHWQDAKLLAFDRWLTGAQPTIWLEQFATHGRNEFMQLAYLTYFTYLLILGGILYFQKDWQAYWSVMTYSMVAYSIGYLIAMFFPVESPWFSLAGSWRAPLEGGPITAIINFIEHYGRVRGAAFPSEHVAGSIAVLWGAWKFRRWFFWIMVPAIFLMCVSTIWGRYHYIADIFAGIITGTLGYFIGNGLMRKHRAVSTVSQSAAESAQAS
jgi:membrane-associated phospholipid phosphatase